MAIVMLTTSNEAIDRIVGLEADDDKLLLIGQRGQLNGEIPIAEVTSDDCTWIIPQGEVQDGRRRAARASVELDRLDVLNLSRR